MVRGTSSGSASFASTSEKAAGSWDSKSKRAGQHLEQICGGLTSSPVAGTVAARTEDAIQLATKMAKNLVENMAKSKRDER